MVCVAFYQDVRTGNFRCKDQAVDSDTFAEFSTEIPVFFWIRADIREQRVLLPLAHIFPSLLVEILGDAVSPTIRYKILLMY